MVSNILKKGIGCLRIFSTLKRHAAIYPELINKPQGSTILVLSPHPDDDVIGCGGTLCKHHLVGDEITTIYLTDGCKGDPTFPNEHGLVKERQKEAREAAEIIGIKNMVFLNHRDQELKKSKETVGQMIDLLEEIRPDIVYLPFLLDNHPDHIATNEIFADACKSMECNLSVILYEIWTPLMPNCVVDISEHIQRKIDAMKQYKTQLKHIDYIEKIKGLNTYRAITARKDIRYCEAFYKCSRQGYINIAKKMRLI